MTSYTFSKGPSVDSGWTAPLFLLLAAALVMAFLIPGFWRLALLVGVIGLACEIVGVHCGLPFGRYHYTAALAPSILSAPVVIGCAWLILFAYVKQVLRVSRIPPKWMPLVGSGWMVALDLMIDPLASGPLGYWVWQNKGIYYGIPTINFVGWFLVSLALFFLLRQPWPVRKGVIWIGLSLILFFTLIGLARGILGAWLVGAGLCILHMLAIRSGIAATKRSLL
ncbi:MAG: carotenoid biosynthesis protein [Rhodospirillales bacterium]|nr:carotenoid biosynthesis protein [Rhodospirillales bacterium]